MFVATKALRRRGLLQPVSRVIAFVQLLAITFSIASVIAAQAPPTTTFPAVTDAEITAFMRSQPKDAKVMLAFHSNPKRVPLLLGAIKRDPAGFWATDLYGICFLADCAEAGRMPVAERPKTYARVMVYLSAAQGTLSKALEKDPRNPSLQFNLDLINKSLAQVRAKAANGNNDTRAIAGSGASASTPSRVGSTPARNAAVAGARTKVCESHLTQIDLAKKMWQEDNKKPETAVPTVTDLNYYLPNHRFPVCPDGGTYVIGRLNQKPTCSFPGHLLSPQTK